jgi:hypothetical protein
MGDQMLPEGIVSPTLHNPVEVFGCASRTFLESVDGLQDHEQVGGLCHNKAIRHDH